METDLNIYVESIKGLSKLAVRESENLWGRFDEFTASLKPEAQGGGGG